MLYGKKNNLLIMSLFLAFLFLGRFKASAISLIRVSDTIRSSIPAVYTDHTVRFRTSTAIPAGGKITITPQAGAFYMPSLFSATDIDLAAGTSETGIFYDFQISSTTASSSKIIDYNVLGFSTGAGPRSSAVGDFNNDGYDDVAVADETAGSVSIFLNNQSNGFNRSDKTAGVSPAGVAIGDFNNDGFADIVAVNAGSDTVSIFLNNQNGTFADKTDLATGANPSSVAAGDINIDGNVDIAVANYASGTISIIRNIGTSTFAAKIDYSAGSSPSSLVLSDLNNDNYPDLAFVNSGSSTVSTMLSSNGLFGIRQNCDTGADPSSVVSGDFNKDGYPDFAVANYASSSLSIFRNNLFGAPLCSSRIDYVAGINPKDIVAGDFNRDRFIDLAVVNAGDDTASIFLNNFNGSFLGKLDNPTVQNPSSIGFGDFNNDGENDLVITGFNNNEMSVWNFLDTEYFYMTNPSAIASGVEIVSDSFNGHIIITLPSLAGIDAGAYVRIKLGKNASFGSAGIRQIMNPTSNGSYKININTSDNSDILLDRADAMIATIGSVAMSAGIVGRYNESPARGSILVKDTTETIVSIQTMNDAECHLAMINNVMPAPYSTVKIKDYGYAYDAAQLAASPLAPDGSPRVLMADSFNYVGSSTVKFHSTSWSGLENGKQYFAYVRCKYANNNFVDTDDYQIYFKVEGDVSTGTSTTEGDGGGTGGGGGSGGGTGTTGSGGGGSGGGGSGSLLPYPPASTTPIVELSGWAYPLSPVSVFKDGKIEKEIKADASAQFLTTISDLAQGVYTFGLSAKDNEARVSSIKNTTFWIKKGTKTTVADIFIAPTVDLNKSLLTAGDILEVFGQSVPQSTIEVWITPVKDKLLDSEIIKKTGQTSGSGNWKISVEADSLGKGEYRIKARSNITRAGYSDFSSILSCGKDAAITEESPCDRADLNKDKKRNIIDFSIMMYHWNTNHATGDINQDGKVNLIDFSMLMFCWTG